MRTLRWRSMLGSALLGLLLASPAIAKSYSADRFDSFVRLLPDGTLDVTETLVLRFEEGSFTEVYREIPRRRTDGIDIVSAEMQGRRLPLGSEAGTVEIRHQNGRLRVTWRFKALENATREFVLNYRVHGVVRQSDAADLLVWRATPSEHRYRIDSSTIRFELPVAPAAPPQVTARRAGQPSLHVSGNIVRIETSAIRANGWIDAALTFDRGAVIRMPPEWQRHAARIAAQSPIWMISAAIVALAGLMLLVAWRQGYDTPPREIGQVPGGSPGTVPPDNLAPAVAGVLASNGRTGLEHAMAALVSLASRGALDITELPRGPLGHRDFLLTRRRRPHGSLAAYEEAVLETAFHGHGAEGSVKLSQARSRLTRHGRRFSRAMQQELRARGLLDDYRKQLRDRYNKAAVWLLAIGLVAFVPAGLLTAQHGAWPLLLPVTILVLALSAVFFGIAMTPLSNDGLRRAHRWREYRKHLANVARGRTAALDHPDAMLPLAVALGLSAAWAKHLKQRSHEVPGWFHALRGRDDPGAFPAFIVTGGAGHASGGAAGSGAAGAAGGGASGAH